MPTLEEVEQIAKIFDVPVESLLVGMKEELLQKLLRRLWRRWFRLRVAQLEIAMHEQLLKDLGL